MADPTCEAQVGEGEVCGETASWRRQDGLLLCQAHNDFDLEHGPGRNQTREGVWEDFTEPDETIELVAPQPPVINLTFEDTAAFLIQKMGQTGLPEGLLAKLAAIGVQRYIEAHDRWERGENDSFVKRAPLWLDRNEADKLVAMLAGQRGTTARLIRQSIASLFDE